MFTYKFLGLSREDAETPYYYGSLPVKPAPGQTLFYEDTGNRYAIIAVEGEGLVGDDDHANQKELAWADISRGEKVPTLLLQKLAKEPVPSGWKDIRHSGRSFTWEAVKEASQKNRKMRLSKDDEAEVNDGTCQVAEGTSAGGEKCSRPAVATVRDSIRSYRVCSGHAGQMESTEGPHTVEWD